MGFFDKFKSKKKRIDIDNVIVGYFRIETSQLLDIKPNSQEYDQRMLSAKDIIQNDFAPHLNKKIQQDIANTLLSVSSERFEEMFGEYLFLLFVRFGVITGHVRSGKVKAEDATPDILANVIHDQIKKIISDMR